MISLNDEYSEYYTPFKESKFKKKYSVTKICTCFKIKLHKLEYDWMSTYIRTGHVAEHFLFFFSISLTGSERPTQPIK
jgi:hypothetical protein